MTGSDRPLPTPPRPGFGRDSREEAVPTHGLTSDRLALAAAEGRLEEFLQHEIPEGDHARNLTMMMMGMSGLMPAETPARLPEPVAPHGPVAPSDAAASAAPEVPPGVLAAVQQGDVANLMGILRTEHAKRSAPDAAADGAPWTPDAPARPTPPSPVSAAGPPAAGRAGIDAALVDELIRIGADNDVTVDWLMLRAVKLYVEEHRKTGRL